MASYDDLDGLLDDLVQAAIDADMWKRGYTWQDGDHYEDPMRWRHVYRGDPGRNDMGPTEDTTDYEAEVFQQWPATVEKIFAAWRADVLPDPTRFRSQIDALRACAEQVDLPSVIAPPAELRRLGRVVQTDGAMGHRVEVLRDGLGPLEGGWVDAFHREYVLPLPYVVGNQGAVLELLATNIEAEAELWRVVRQAVADLAEAGAAWFRRVMHDGKVWDLVVEVGKAMYTVWELPRSKNPVEAGKGVLELIGSGSEIKTLLDQNVPPDPSEIPTDVDGIRTLIAQRLEYTICRQVEDGERALQTVLRDTTRAMRTSRGTFETGDSDLQRVASATDVLAPQQRLDESDVERTVRAMYGLSDAVTSAASGIVTSVYPFVRPASIGLGSNGPYDAVLELENEIHHAMHATARNLDRAATVVRICADYAFAADGESASELCRVDERLERAQERFEDDILPPGRGESPYTPPDVQVHVEVPPCEPYGHLGGDDPFAPQEPWHAPMAPPEPR